MTKQPPSAALGRGRTTYWEKVDLVVLERHAGYLDAFSIVIRLRHHKVLTRAELVRAFVEFMHRSGIDFTAFATPEDMVSYLTAHFGRNPNRMRLAELLELYLFQPKRAAKLAAQREEADEVT